MTNSKNTKRALLSSALALLVCVAMLIGTTFAWFTDTASTAVNKIQAGTLDIALEMKDGDEWVSAEGKTLNFKAADGRTNILWEPGCTYELPELRIVNKGNLALKYKVVISGINGDAKLNEAIDWYYSVDLSSVLPGANGWTEPSDLYKLDNFGGEDYLLTEGNAANARTDASVFKIIGKMRTDAGNEYQGLSIDGIAITVVATQYTYENDSYNNQYDKDAPMPSVWTGDFVAPTLGADGVYHITTAEEFAYIVSRQVNAGTKYSIDADINLNGRTITTDNQRPLDNVTIEGNYHTVSNFVMDNTNNPENYYGGLFGYFYKAGSIKNLTVADATIVGGNQVGGIIGAVEGANTVVENCHVVNCTVVGAKKVGAVVGYTASGVVKDCSATDCNVYCETADTNEAGEVVGFINTVDVGQVDNTSGNTAENVNVYTNAITVFTAEELAAKLPVGGNIYLMNDIDLNNEPWTPVFMNYGTFDGQGHTIKNLKVEADACPDMGNGYGAALIYWSNGSIVNLNVDGADIEGYHNAGAIAGWVNGYAAKIENCHVKNAMITINHKNNDLCGDKAGAVAGRVAINVPSANCTAENCTVKGCRDVGQVFGAATASVSTGCSATNVTAGLVADSTCGNGNGNNIGGVIGRDLV